MPPQDAVDASVGDPDAVIALEIPDDPDGPEVVGTAKMDDLLDDTPAGCTASDSRGRASGGPALRPHAPLRPASTDRQPPVTRRSVRLQPPPRSRPGHRARRPASRALVVPAVGCRQAPSNHSYDKAGVRDGHAGRHLGALGHLVGGDQAAPDGPAYGMTPRIC